MREIGTPGATSWVVPCRPPFAAVRVGRSADGGTISFVVKIPAIRGVIERRLLVNYRVDPEALDFVVPEPFRPLLIDGVGIAGICLIRLGHLRPAMLPGRWGASSENGAHRVAVLLPDGSEGVYIPRRDTNSRLNTLLGGRLFPGLHHHARFTTFESDERIEVEMTSDDGAASVAVAGRPTSELPAGSVFGSVKTASSFFERGSLGYSDTRDPTRYDALELRTSNWRVTPLEVDHVSSSFFEDRERFPPGTVEFDNALVMRDVDHEWHARDTLYCSGIPETASTDADQIE